MFILCHYIDKYLQKLCLKISQSISFSKITSKHIIEMILYQLKAERKIEGASNVEINTLFYYLLNKITNYFLKNV